jgi:hypothetical protein
VIAYSSKKQILKNLRWFFMPLLKELIVIQIIVSFLDFKKQVQKGKWSWDQILQDQKSFLMRLKEQSWDQKSFFQEIKCAVFYETKKLLIMFFWVLISWMISYSQYNHEIESLKNIHFDFWSHYQSCLYKNVHEIKSLKSIIFDFQSHEKFVIHKCNHEIKSFYAQAANN